MNKKIGGNDMLPMGQNNSSVMNYGQNQQQRPVSYEQMRKRSPTTQ